MQNTLFYFIEANCFRRKLSVSSIQTTRAEIHQETPPLSTGEEEHWVS